MSGHSKWANIKRRKGKQDDIRGQIFTKIAKEIMVAVKQGGPDPDGNFRLKLCIQKAKANNMPNDNIARSIQKAAGAGDSEAFEEIFYEGYGPAGVAVLCEILTDNRNRTASEVRYIFSRKHGNLGETGCVAWMFERKGRMVIDAEAKDEDELMLAAIEAGAENIEFDAGEAEVITAPDELESVREQLIAAGIEPTEAEISMLPKNTVEITDLEAAKQILILIEALEENEDIQNVYHNADISEELLNQID